MSTPEPTAPESEKLSPTIKPEEGVENFSVSTEDLFAMQDKVFGKEPEQNTPPPEPKKEPSKSRAEDLLARHQKLGDKPIEKPADKKEPPKTEPPAPEAPPVPTIEFLPGAKKEPPKTEPPAPTPEADIERENNVKNLRGIATGFKAERDTYAARVAELEKQLSETPSIDALNVEIERLRARNAELEPLEVVHNLKQHPEYKTKYLDGEKQLRGEMEKIATDYGVDPKVVEEVIAITNRKDLDEILTEVFSTESARQDMKLLKSRIDGLYNERREFEKKPEETLQRWESEREQRETATAAQREAHFARVANDAWAGSLAAAKNLPQDKKLYELVEVPGNKQHNEQVVRPTLAEAKRLVDTGLTHIERMIKNGAVIDSKFADWFTAVVQQAVVTQMLNSSRLEIWNKYQELLKNQEKAHADDAPPLNGSPRSPGSSNGSFADGSPASIWASVMTAKN